MINSWENFNTDKNHIEEINMVKDFFISLKGDGSLHDTEGVGAAEKRDIKNLDEYSIHIVGYQNMSNLIELFNKIENYILDDEDYSGEQGKDENYWLTIYKK